jgi:DNA-3-methyladenine glycosylase
MTILLQGFFSRPTETVARDLLGKHLVRVLDGVRLAGIITEVEAYIGEDDQACHAKSGMTTRNSAMYGPPGQAYVYFIYGMHWMLNVVTEREGFPAAILIRSLEVCEGSEIISNRRKGADTYGPAKLTQALGIDSAQNEAKLYDQGGGIWIEPGNPITGFKIIRSPRVGLFSVPEPWKSIPWRFQLISDKDQIYENGVKKRIRH